MLKKLIDAKSALEEKIKTRSEILPPIPGFFEMTKYHPTPIQIYKNLLLSDNSEHLKNTFLFFMQNKKKTADFSRRVTNLMNTLRTEGLLEEVKYFDQLKAILRRFYVGDGYYAKFKELEKYAAELVNELYPSNPAVAGNRKIDNASKIERGSFFRDLFGF